MTPVTFEAAENEPIFSGRSAWAVSSASSRARSIRPSWSSGIDDHVGERLAPGQLVAVVLVGADEHDRTLVGRDRARGGRTGRRGRPGARISRQSRSLSIAPVEPEPAKRTTWSSLVAADRVADDRAGRPRGTGSSGDPVPGRLGVGVAVERQDRLADEVLDERQRSARGRVVGVRDAAQAERSDDRLVVADDGGADRLDEARRGARLVHGGMVRARESDAAGRPRSVEGGPRLAVNKRPEAGRSEGCNRPATGKSATRGRQRPGRWQRDASSRPPTEESVTRGQQGAREPGPAGRARPPSLRAISDANRAIDGRSAAVTRAQWRHKRTFMKLKILAIVMLARSASGRPSWRSAGCRRARRLDPVPHERGSDRRCDEVGRRDRHPRLDGVVWRRVRNRATSRRGRPPRAHPPRGRSRRSRSRSATSSRPVPSWRPVIPRT